MALHAQFQLPLPAQPRGVDDGSLRRFPRLHGLDMGAPGAMAALAIDAIGDRSAKNRRRSGSIGTLFNLGITVVAEHALIGDLAAKILLIGAVVTRIHGPVALFFGVPADWQLTEPTVGTLVQIGARVVSGPDNEVDLFLNHVGLFAVETNLVTALIN